MGGNGPQSLVNLTCLAIQRGDADLVLLGGAEAWRTRMGARSAGVELDWTVQDDVGARGAQVDPRGADVVAGRAGPRA